MVNQRRFLTLTLILFGIFLLAGMSPADPAGEYIGPNGGKINLDDGSKLEVPKGALGDAQTALIHMDNGQVIIREVGDYVSKLNTKKGDTEWINGRAKKNLLTKIKEIYRGIEGAIRKTKREKYGGAAGKVSRTLKKLDKANDYMSSLIKKGAISQSAADNITGYIGIARKELHATISAPDYLLGTKITIEGFTITIEDDEGGELNILVYEFLPSGIVFKIPVSFAIPFSLLGGSLKEPPTVYWSQDGREIQLADIGSKIDKNKKRVKYHIWHFTYYYFPY